MNLHLWIVEDFVKKFAGKLFITLKSTFNFLSLHQHTLLVERRKSLKANVWNTWITIYARLLSIFFRKLCECDVRFLLDFFSFQRAGYVDVKKKH